jgi:hypothetical protein
MDIRTAGEVRCSIHASPAAAYELVSDVTRTGEWSPECRRCRWIDGTGQPRPGARFRGWNRSGLIRWSRLVEVVAAEPGAEFAFRTIPDRLNRDSTTWRYRFEADGDSTLVTESYQVHRLASFPVNVIFRLFLRHHADMRPQMTQTLKRLKTLLEAGAGPATPPS